MGLAGGHTDITHSLGANKKLALHNLFHVAEELMEVQDQQLMSMLAGLPT
jgi:hypothetical protein